MQPTGKAIAAWCLYDWAMSAFNTVIGTFVFSVYVTKAVAADPVSGAAAWGFALGAAGLAIAVLAPFLGATVDRTGRIKPWLAATTSVTVIGSACLWFVEPDPAFLPLALVLMGLCTVAFELANVFYSALLPQVAPAAKIGRVSGWGWGVGYLGGLGSLILCLILLIQTPTPLFGWLTTDESSHIRATAVLVAIWYGVFAIPLFLLVRDRPAAPMATASVVKMGMHALLQTLRGLAQQGNTVRFMIASALWRDGINTITAFGGIYAASMFGMTTAQVILFAILLNVTAGFGAIGFAWLDDWIGAKATLVISIVGLFLTGLGMLLLGTSAWEWAPVLHLPLEFTPDQQWLLVLGMALGIFFGPAQSASRSMMIRLSPVGQETEFLGLYALTGRAASFFGPLAFSAATAAFVSQRAGMATVLIFFVVGLLLLITVRDPHHQRITGSGA